MTAPVTVRNNLIAYSAAAVAELNRLTAEADRPRLLIGGSCQQGYPELRTRLTGVLPCMFTHFVATPRITVAELDKMAVYVLDGVIPSLSFPVGTQADTDFNVAQLVARGFDRLAGGYSIGNEPTQKAPTATEWRAANQYAATVLPPAWTLVAGPFQRVDIMAAVTDPRFIGNWLGPDPSWIGALGCNVYDKNQSVGSTFEQLVKATGPGPNSVEGYARQIGKRLWIREAGAPEAGTWNRPTGWKPAWYRAMYTYCACQPDLYHTVNPFNSAIGGDPPPEGWQAWTSPEALAAYRETVAAARVQ